MSSSVGEDNCHFDHVPCLGIPQDFNSNYAWKGLSIYVKFSLGKRLGTRQNIIQIIHKKIKITPAVECVTKSTNIVFVIKSPQFEISQEY